MSEHDLDQLLREFFQAQMPREFPLPPLPKVVMPSPPPTPTPLLPSPAPESLSPIWASRASLAASIALVLSGSWYLLSNKPAERQHSTPTSAVSSSPTPLFQHSTAERQAPVLVIPEKPATAPPPADPNLSIPELEGSP